MLIRCRMQDYNHRLGHWSCFGCFTHARTAVGSIAIGALPPSCE